MRIRQSRQAGKYSAEAILLAHGLEKSALALSAAARIARLITGSLKQSKNGSVADWQDSACGCDYYLVVACWLAKQSFLPFGIWDIQGLRGMVLPDIDGQSITQQHPYLTFYRYRLSI